MGGMQERLNLESMKDVLALSVRGDEDGKNSREGQALRGSERYVADEGAEAGLGQRHRHRQCAQHQHDADAHAPGALLLLRITCETKSRIGSHGSPFIWIG